MKAKNYLLVLVAVLLIGALLLRNIFHASKGQHRHGTETGSTLNRNDDRIILTNHARCRMDCRHITKDEIKEILHNGNINYDKSDPDDTRGPEYALEGYTHEHQHLRVVFSPADDGLVVVTCIDLDNEWHCDCN